MCVGVQCGKTCFFLKKYNGGHLCSKGARNLMFFMLISSPWGPKFRGPNASGQPCISSREMGFQGRVAKTSQQACTDSEDKY